jgi:Putative addiction module component
MGSAESILAEALELSEDDRARVALRLCESLSGSPDLGSDEAWALEIAKRIERLRDGTARTVTAAEALAGARARLSARRG